MLAGRSRPCLLLLLCMLGSSLGKTVQGEELNPWSMYRDSDDAPSASPESGEDGGKFSLVEFQPPTAFAPSLSTQPRARPAPGRQLRFGTAGGSARLASQPTYMIADTSAGGCGGLFIEGNLVASIMHPTFACSRLNIAENNSPTVQDRAYFSYRHFHNASEIEVFSNTPGGGVGQQNIDRYTFGLERRLLCDCCSVEFRLPVNSQLNSDLFFAQFENEQTVLPLSDYVEELGNVSLILKHRILEAENVYISGGLAFNFPTAPDVRIRGLVDDPNFVIRDSDGNDTGVRADVDLTVDGLVRNETVNVSPFVGFVWQPSERWFTQGFGQIDVAINESDGIIDLDARLRILPTPITLVRDLHESDRLAQQTLLRLNWGVGYWLIDEPDAPYLNQLGIMFEAHYTTTLNDAKLLGPLEVLPQFLVIPPVVLTVGNIANRVDVVNMVVGVPTRIGRTTLTHGFVFPVRESPDRGFDFEYSLLVNRQF